MLLIIWIWKLELIGITKSNLKIDSTRRTLTDIVNKICKIYVKRQFEIYKSIITYHRIEKSFYLFMKQEEMI